MPTLKPARREEVLKDADVVAAHPALDGDAVAEAVVRAVVVGVVGEAAVGVGARAAQRALEGLDGARADRAAGLQARGALEALDRPQRPGAEVAVHLHLEAGLARAPAGARAHRVPRRRSAAGGRRDATPWPSGSRARSARRRRVRQGRARQRQKSENGGRTAARR